MNKQFTSSLAAEHAGGTLPVVAAVPRKRDGMGEGSTAAIPEVSGPGRAHSLASPKKPASAEFTQPGRAALSETPFVTLAVRVKILDAPAWFEHASRMYAQCLNSAYAAIAKRPEGDKTAISSIAFRAMPKDVPSHLRESASMEVQATWRSYKANYKQGKERSRPGVQATMRFCLHRRALAVYPERRQVWLRAHKKQGLYSELSYECGEFQDLRLLQAVYYGEPEVKKLGGQWWLTIPIRLLPSDEPGPLLAVLHPSMRRLYSALMVAPSGIASEITRSSESYWARRRAWRSLRAHLQRRRKRLVIRRIGQRESHWASWFMHTETAHLAKRLYSAGVGMLVIGAHRNIRQSEKKSFSKTSNWRSANWGFAMFVERLKYKCELAGIKVILVNEAKIKTAANCFYCGETTDREKGELICRCGRRMSVQWNAMHQLLAATGFDGQLKFQRGLTFIREKLADQYGSGFSGERFSVPDMAERLAHWGLTNNQVSKG